MIETIRRLLWVTVCLAALPAGATHHLWKMTELYSNADGSIQFLKFATDANGEEFLTNHGLVAQGRSTNSFVFPSDLPGSTGGKTFLVATQGFAALGVLTPDYIVPNGFFSVDGGSILFSTVDSWDHPSLPRDGSLSLFRDGNVSTNSPQNFAGDKAVLSAALSAPNFQAMWWKASESGWGLNITHQGDVLFATWFTYDTDGRGMWLVAPDARKSAGNTYSGALYRTTGPVFSAVPFDSSRVVVTQVGNVTLSFTDGDNGTFAYSVDGVTQSKAITRQVYSQPASTCASVTAGVTGTRVSYQDLWWRSPAGSESGWGLNITHQGDILFATWFTYDPAGRGMWLVAPDAHLTAPGSYTGTLYRTTGPAFSASPWNASQVAVATAGTATLTFADAGHGTFAYTVDGVSQTKPIMRQVFSTPATVCR